MSDSRLDASAQPAGDGVGPPFRPCLWCGTPLASRVPEAEFCGTPCRKSFNNLRAMRGAELYDLFMALRWDRTVSTGLHLFTVLSRMAAGFRAEDLAEREGRRSWRHPKVILARRPYLLVERLRASTKRGG